MKTDSDQTKKDAHQIEQAATELIVRYGANAIGEATEFAEVCVRGGRWIDHDKALRVLSAIEIQLCHK